MPKFLSENHCLSKRCLGNNLASQRSLFQDKQFSRLRNFIYLWNIFWNLANKRRWRYLGLPRIVINNQIFSLFMLLFHTYLYLIPILTLTCSLSLYIIYRTLLYPCLPLSGPSHTVFFIPFCPCLPFWNISQFYSFHTLSHSHVSILFPFIVYLLHSVLVHFCSMSIHHILLLSLSRTFISIRPLFSFFRFFLRSLPCRLLLSVTISNYFINHILFVVQSISHCLSYILYVYLCVYFSVPFISFCSRPSPSLCKSI